MNRSEILQTAKPILFNTDMVRAILDGRKTVTRRVMKLRYREDEGGFQVCTNRGTGESWVEKTDWDGVGFDNPRYVKPPYNPGNILYVRETWGTYNRNWWEADYFMYRADYPEKASTYMYSDGIVCDLPKWRPSIHMPKEAARIFLRVTDVRVERLQDMSYIDFLKEGIVVETKGVGRQHIAEQKYKKLWNSTIPKKGLDKYGWDANPWVWVIEFEKVEVEP